MVDERLDFISNSNSNRSPSEKQSVFIKEIDTLPGGGVVVVVVPKYKYLYLRKFRWIYSFNVSI